MAVAKALSVREEVVKERLGLTSNYAVAYAVKAVDVDVIAAYPITPQTTIIEKLAEFVANGEIDAEYIPVESEHSALSAVVGAAAAGARVFTATSAQGLEFMHEVLYITSGLRLPVVMAVPGRALSAPISIHGDYQDIMSARDAGWIMLIASSAQEVYDSIIMAYRIAEDGRVLLPVMVAYDGFLMSHTTEPVEIYHEEYVRKFTPRNLNRYRLDPRSPITIGVITSPDWYYEIKYQAIKALKDSKGIIKEVHEEFNKSFGTNYDIIEKYMLDDADYVLITYGGASSGNAKEAAKRARERGLRAGVLRIRLFRPFPTDEVVNAIKDAKAIAVIDRALSPGNTYEGPVFNDVVSALYSRGVDKPVISVVHGISQRTMLVDDFYNLYKMLDEYAKTGEYPRKTIFMGLRGGEE
ncbi:pyruvate flavodoxin/ferredoxin oxidoreductase [Vulcanisaeta distributa]|uniref:2-oxoacid oxidoreductase (ferredoxin) n=1 Tax=Vulcanisaeta distributa (strain DSM 14429 / JCM 11212 / NBRC 100878 / IC-017) TaxID=572478 RepID=E1QNM1_VULDI|nr:pyruvate flavodoxin/ferredoxin oxidoreductase [Vulcanisaeta distributa]ADN51309.1 pyruvate flavodoxin/ferredoxin oxidoreductase domain protein [Vulcanisaeta distributa DSM 14429]